MDRAVHYRVLEDALIGAAADEGLTVGIRDDFEPGDDRNDTGYVRTIFSFSRLGVPAFRIHVYGKYDSPPVFVRPQLASSDRVSSYLRSFQDSLAN